jgi:NADP-dependent aldehyde dehydrogenase
MPASLRRFAMLACFDNVRQNRLPLPLRNQNSNGRMWRLIDGRWTTDDISEAEVAKA